MKVLTVRNVHEALPRALKLLDQVGIERPSRNGPVKQAPWPVVTIYERPTERVLFWPERDANPFFHLYESLWMLAGRNDIAPLVRYAKNMANYSDDGVTQHGAYGHRWRNHFLLRANSDDQLKIIAETLQRFPDDRRCVLQMWNPLEDLGSGGKDLPCNVTATFQRDAEGKLDLTVFCRSNDIVWGAYGANAVHFSMLLEYMANWISCPVGVYRQISVNWHGYVSTFTPLLALTDSIGKYNDIANPYVDREQTQVFPITGPIEEVDGYINTLLDDADHGFEALDAQPPVAPFARVWFYALKAHHYYKSFGSSAALALLDEAPQNADWVQAAQQWLQRRAHRQ